MRLRPVGERARLVALAPTWRTAAGRARHTLAAARAVARRWPALDVVPGAGELLLDGLDRLALPGHDASGDRGAREAWLDDLLAGELASVLGGAALDLDPGAGGEPVTIATVYDGADLDEVARQVGGSVADVVKLHASAVYTVELLGFLPGFAYLGPAPAPLALARRSTPRPVVPAGSVAVAAGFTGVYPSATPGGWHLLGRAPGFVPFAADDGRPTLTPGASVRFVAVDPGAPAAPAPGRTADGATGRAASGGRVGARVGPGAVSGRSPALVVVRAPAGASVQDAGRRGLLSRGLPPSGPLDEALAAAANEAAGNEAGEAAVEVPLGPCEVEAVGAVVVSVDGGPPRRLRDGERLAFGPRERAVAYLAVTGGIDTPAVQGSRAVLVTAGLGGRALRAGDVLPVGDRAARSARPPARAPAAPPEPALLLFVAGPHLDRFPAGALDRLEAGEFRVSALGNRVGVRLEGERVPTGAGRLDLPSPMVRGAIEVAADGTPIVLGPDHPVTGGYPVIGVLTRSAQGRLARMRPGQRVRLVRAG